MARAYGANALFLSAFETAYGVPPASGFVKFPFVSSSLGSEQGLIDSDILGQSLRTALESDRAPIRHRPHHRLAALDLRHGHHRGQAQRRRSEEGGFMQRRCST